MNTSIKHLPSVQRQRLNELTAIISRTIPLEKIILIGIHSLPCDFSDPTETWPPNHDLTCFDLLVLTRPQERHTDYELQDLLESRCRHIAPITVIVHDIDYANRQIRAGQYFFSMACMEGILLHDARLSRLEPAGLPNFAKVKALAEKDFERWSGAAHAFFRSGTFNLQNKDYKIAVFQLHQAAEQIYQAILLVFNGYKPTTHNLDKLRRYTNRFSIELTALFPRHTDSEDDLFKLLLSGYVDARYKEDFDVSESDVVELSVRVGKLLDIAGRICKNHLHSLEKKIGITPLQGQRSFSSRGS